ncbi:MAG: amidohydrolase [Microvirga sp.]
MGSIAIRGGRLVDRDRRSAIPQDILVVDGRIVEIAPPGCEAPEGAERIDANDRLLIPGLVNAHTHAHGALAKGLCGDRWPLELLLNANPAFNRGRTIEDKYLSGLLNAVELVRRGCTTCFDMFAEFPMPSVEGIEAVGRAYADVGLRAVLAPSLADRTLYQAIPGLMEALPEAMRQEVERIQAAPFHASLDVCRTLVERWPFDRAMIRPGLAPTIPLHCSDEFLIACGELSRALDLPIQTHLAESRTQALAAVRRYGRSLTAHLDELGLLSPRLSAAHAIWLDSDDVRRLADRGSSVVHNPLSNARLGSGIADIRRLATARVNVGIGTDAVNTSDALNMFEATRWAAYLSRIEETNYGLWLGPDEVFQMATEGSARAIGFEKIGSLTPGHSADIVFLDLAHVNYVPLNDVLRQLVFGESGAAVDSVMIAGRMVVQSGRLLTVDEEGLRRKVEAAVERFREAAVGAGELARVAEEYVGAFCVAQAQMFDQRCGCRS